MNDLRTAAQQALEAMRCAVPTGKITLYAWDKAMAELSAALEQQAEPVQEPVAWLYTGIKQDGTEHGPHLVWKPEYMDAMSASKGAKATPLYTAPPQQAEPVALKHRHEWFSTGGMEPGQFRCIHCGVWAKE